MTAFSLMLHDDFQTTSQLRNQVVMNIQPFAIDGSAAL
ncbi:hypothetical protein CFII64_20653 [Pseudomonas sp. CFII64]|nr:hypothetical protein CFII64_20653 [Pseudomonas sp. CFII64]